MSRYELLYVIPATYADTELQPVIDAINGAVSKLGAQVTRSDMVGKLKLAYPIERVRHGFYVLVDLEVEDAKLSEIDKMLRLHSDVLRHQMVVKDKKAKPLFKLVSMEEVDRDRVRDRAADTGMKTRQGAGAPAAPGKKVEVDMADIDKKLDKIVEGNIL